MCKIGCVNYARFPKSGHTHTYTHARAHTHTHTHVFYLYPPVEVPIIVSYYTYVINTSKCSWVEAKILWLDHQVRVQYSYIFSIVLEIPFIVKTL